MNLAVYILCSFYNLITSKLLPNSVEKGKKFDIQYMRIERAFISMYLGFLKGGGEKIPPVKMPLKINHWSASSVISALIYKRRFSPISSPTK